MNKSISGNWEFSARRVPIITARRVESLHDYCVIEKACELKQTTKTLLRKCHDEAIIIDGIVESPIVEDNEIAVNVVKTSARQPTRLLSRQIVGTASKIDKGFGTLYYANEYIESREPQAQLKIVKWVKN